MAIVHVLVSIHSNSKATVPCAIRLRRQLSLWLQQERTRDSKTHTG